MIPPSEAFGRFKDLVAVTVDRVFADHGTVSVKEAHGGGSVVVPCADVALRRVGPAAFRTAPCVVAEVRADGAAPVGKDGGFSELRY